MTTHRRGYTPLPPKTYRNWGRLYGLVASGSVIVLQIMDSDPSQPYMGVGWGKETREPTMTAMLDGDGIWGNFVKG